MVELAYVVCSKVSFLYEDLESWSILNIEKVMKTVITSLLSSIYRLEYR
jgi:hypothetical protein